MPNLIADLKYLLNIGCDNIIAKHDFHKGDDFLVGFAILDRSDMFEIIEFFTNDDEDLFDADFFEYNYESITSSDILAALSIHSTLKRDVDDMKRIFGGVVGDCYWLDGISNWAMENQITVGDRGISLTLTPELLDKSDLRFFPFATVEALETIANAGVFDLYSGLRELPEGSAKLIIGDGDLDLSGLTSVSDADVKALSEHKGSLYLDRLTELSCAAAESLSKYQGDLSLDGLTELSDTVAESLSKHEGELYLNSLTELSDASAEALSKHQGFLSLTGLTKLSDAAAESLSEHKALSLDLDCLTELSDAAAEALSEYL